MKKYELIGCVAWVVVGLIFCKGAIGFGLGTLNEPGPGFFPFWMSVSLISFSVIHFLSSLKKEGTPYLPAGPTFWPEAAYMVRIIVIICLLFMFVIALNHLGFVVTTLLFMFLLLKFIEPRKTRTVLLIACLTTVFAYGIFELWLNTNLPRGFLGF